MSRLYPGLLLIGIIWVNQALPTEGAIIAKVAPSGESIELEWQSEGRTMSSSMPLYVNGAVRYFTAGVGLEERSAHYPPFPLKIVFTAGNKPFLSHVGVTIQPVKGGEAIIIPPEQVEGPWLFVDLPPGGYDMSGTFSGHVQQLNGIKIELNRQKTVHFRWKEEPVPVRIAEDLEVGGNAEPSDKEGQ